MANGHPDEAEKALATIRGVSVEDNEFSVRQSWIEIDKSIKEEEAMQKMTWIECFYPGKKMLYRTLLLMVLQSLQQLTGANYFVCSPALFLETLLT